MPDALQLKQLPLFPLNTNLFPGGRLPLRVFELRYLDMIGKCQRAGSPFGVVALLQGQEVRRPAAEPERFEWLGTLVHIEQFSRPQPGLIQLLARGEQRFQITQTQQLVNGLWLADVNLLPPDPSVPVPEHLRPAALALQQLHQQLNSPEAATASLLVVPPSASLESYADSAWVANRWAELLPMPAHTRQQLLKLDNPLLRLELVSDMLERAGIGR